MNGGHVSPGVLPALVVAGLLASGCSGPPPSKPVAPPAAPPTAFFEWCVAEDFGVKTPDKGAVAARAEDVPSGGGCVAELRAWTPCRTEEEARAFLASTAADLRRAAEERGVTLQGGDPTDPPGGGILLRYQAGPRRGALEGKYELDDSKEGERVVKRYFLTLTLREGDHAP